MPGFEDRLTQLETIVEKLERGELTLDESIRLFEEGVKLSTACKQELDQAEGRIQILSQTHTGAVHTTPFDPDKTRPE